MQRRTALRRALGVIALTVPFAGCSGSDDGNDGNGDDDSNGDDSDSGDGNGDGPSPTGESGLQRNFEVFPESVGENVELVAVEEVEVSDTFLEVDVTLRNTSDQAVRMDDYSIALVPYSSEDPTDKDATRITGGSPSIEYAAAEQEPTQAGETVTLGFSYQVAEDSSATIRSYEVSVGCPGVGSPPGCE